MRLMGSVAIRPAWVLMWVLWVVRGRPRDLCPTSVLCSSRAAESAGKGGTTDVVRGLGANGSRRIKRLANHCLSLTRRFGDGRCRASLAVDGCARPFADGSVEIVFSNSVIEHVGDADRKVAFARETMLLGRRFYCQTPNTEFP